MKPDSKTRKSVSSRDQIGQFTKDLLNFDLPSYEHDYNDAEGEIVLAEGMCVTLLNVQLLFDIIVHNYAYYVKAYKQIGPMFNRYFDYCLKADSDSDL